MVSRILSLALGVVSLAACNPRVPIYLTAPPELAGASVRVDDQLVATFEGAGTESSPDEAGTTAIFTVSAGHHVIRIEQDGYKPIRIEINYRSDQEGYLDISQDQVMRAAL
jgi:hypothetical protein